MSVRLGTTDALHRLSLAIAPGETLVLLGPSGSGKSTALRLVNALLRPTSGAVIVDGRDVSAWDPIELRRQMGYVIQEVGLLPHMTVARNVGLVPELLGWPEATREIRVAELLSRVGLPEPELHGRYPRELSGGQRQRVGIARALAADPPVLLCDEPFGALDPVLRRQLQDEFRILSAQLGKTLLFVTHDVREALALGTRIALLEKGQLRFLGSPEELRVSDVPIAREFARGINNVPI
ncbi:MAG: ATP-binding cassette domain-containing protein [Gemmatimonadota bacterium]